MKVSRTGAAAACIVTGALAAAGGGLALTSHTSTARAASRARPSLVINTCTGLRTICYSPQDLRTAYDATSLIDGGTDGRGQTVVIVDEVEPAIQKQGGALSLTDSMALFDAKYQLPAAKLSVSTKFAPGASADLGQVTGQGAEVELDAEMVHAMAPGAAIDVDLYSGSPTRSLPAVLRDATGQGHIVSLSFGLGEGCFKSDLPALQSALRDDESHHVSVLAAAGDDAVLSRNCQGKTTSSAGVVLPSADPLITSVGGTYLTVNPHTGAYAHEVAWNGQENGGTASGGLGSSQSSRTPSGTGGGYSRLFPRPSYQQGVTTPHGMRGVPDVAFDASDATAFGAVGAVQGRKECGTLAAEADKVDRRLRHGPTNLKAASSCEIDAALGGTSAATPAWAAIVALADQRAGHPLGLLNPVIYKIGHSSAYPKAFHDITSGNNSVTLPGARKIQGYSAAKGWDPVTGWGTPKIGSLVPLLASGDGSGR